MRLNTSLPSMRAKTLSRLLNLSILGMILLLSGVLVKRNYYDKFNVPRIGPGARLFVKGVDLTKTSRTLLLATNKDCKYCTESARFYRMLAEGLTDKTDVRIVALFPEGSSGSNEYLKTLGLSVSESQQGFLPSLGIQQVPTLVLLDRDGLVSRVWVGRLSPGQETEVMNELQLENTRPVSEWTIDEAELKRRVDNGEPIIVLDLRERSAYAQGHLSEAKNIPFDELYVRAINELKQDNTIVIFDDNENEADSAYKILGDQGFSHVFILTRSSTR